MCIFNCLRSQKRWPNPSHAFIYPSSMCTFHIKTHASAELALSELLKFYFPQHNCEHFQSYYSFHSLLTRREKFRLTQKILQRRWSLPISSIHGGIPQGSGLGCPTCFTLPLIHNRPGVIILKMDDVLNFVRIYSLVCLYLDFSLGILYKSVLYIFLRMRPSVWFGLHVESKCNEPIQGVWINFFFQIVHVG